jgi:hypothetical protein
VASPETWASACSAISRGNPQGLAFADLYEAAQYVWDWMMTPVKAIQETNMSL